MVQVEMSQGVLEGELRNNDFGGTFYSFKGMPYAEPPIDDLRFQKSNTRWILGIQWPEYSVEEQRYLNIGVQLTDVAPNGDEIQFWEEIFRLYYPKAIVE